MRKLYIFWFLHQTTTPMGSVPVLCRCISFDSYIKPQQNNNVSIVITVVYLLIPTSNHNSVAKWPVNHLVVYLLIPTSNHNDGVDLIDLNKLYIFWFLHQTTTIVWAGIVNILLYIFWFLHQTTTYARISWRWLSCISFDSYIKPQHHSVIAVASHVVYLLIPTSNHNKTGEGKVHRYVVYLLIPTSNHNLWCAGTAPERLYIFWFLHQTTTEGGSSNTLTGCISFDSYIKPQHIDLNVLIFST